MKAEDTTSDATPTPPDFTNRDQFCYFLVLGFSLLFFAFGFGSGPHFMYLRPEGRVGVPFCPCGHCRLSQNSILNSQSHALPYASGWKTKAQMSQIPLQLKFHTWPSFPQADTLFNIMKAEVMSIFVLFLLASLVLKVLSLWQKLVIPMSSS